MKITEEILMSLCKKSIENAQELVLDADLLKSKKRFPRAYTLYQLATEEIGKCIYCFLVIYDGDYNKPDILKGIKKVFSSHQFKTEKSSSVSSFIAQVRFKGDFDGALDYLQESIAEKDQLQEIDNLKNYSLYTSIIKDGIQNPSEIITPLLVSKIETKAKDRLNATRAFVQMCFNHLHSIREFQNKNPNFQYDPETAEKIFWDSIIN